MSAAALRAVLTETDASWHGRGDERIAPELLAAARDSAIGRRLLGGWLAPEAAPALLAPPPGAGVAAAALRWPRARVERLVRDLGALAYAPAIRAEVRREPVRRLKQALDNAYLLALDSQVWDGKVQNQLALQLADNLDRALRMDEDAYVSYAAGLGSEEGPGTPGWGALLLDEAQFVKNTGTRAWSIARAMPARTKIAMTGTPLENNLMELWALLAIVADGLFPSARAFRDLYARPAESGEDPAHAAATTARLRRRIRPLMLRRTKELVAAELPAKNDVRVTLPLAPGHRRIYDTHLQRERQKVLGLLEDMDKNRFTIFQSLTLLRRLALDAALIDPEAYAGVSSVKRDYLVQQLPDLLEKGHRVLVFSQFTGYLKSISARLAEEGIGHLYLDGSTRNRAEVIEAFTSGQEPVFLISLKAGGFGLNLTEADHVFIMDPWWNPAAEQQAVDRIHRIGQDKEVHVYRLVAEGTIEEKVMQLKESKAALFDAVVGEGEFASAAVTAEDVRELFALPEEKDAG